MFLIKFTEKVNVQLKKQYYLSQDIYNLEHTGLLL